jgi:hypothetical protein
MRATTPHVTVPGDSEDRIMARSGQCLGMSKDRAVWRFGFSPRSERAFQTGTFIEGYGFLWVLATRKLGVVKDTFRGYAVELPESYRKVLRWEPQ